MILVFLKGYNSKSIREMVQQLREDIMGKFLRSLRVFRLIKVWQIGLLALVLPFGGYGTGLEKT